MEDNIFSPDENEVIYLSPNVCIDAYVRIKHVCAGTHLFLYRYIYFLFLLFIYFFCLFLSLFFISLFILFIHFIFLYLLCIYLFFSSSIHLFIYLQSMASSNFWNLIMTKSKSQHRTTPNCLTLRHSNFFSCSNPLRLPMNYDPSSKKITGARSSFEHLESNEFSKIFILPHESHISYKYKCMNDGFFFNQRADQKNLVRAEQHSM